MSEGSGQEVKTEMSGGFSSHELAWRNGEESSAASLSHQFGAADGSAPWDVPASITDEFARAELAAAPWWLWWNVLSLDAPMVAAAWALVFAKSAGVALPGAEVAALALAVWLIYTVDRLLDGQASTSTKHAPTALFALIASTNGVGAFGSPLRQRHIFHRVHAGAIACVAVGVAAFTGVLAATQIGERVLESAVALGLILVVYMAWVHLGRGRVWARLPKEVAVGGVFAAGVALPVWSRIGTRRWEFVLLAMLFAVVCTLNCVAIEEWERVRGRCDNDSGQRTAQAGAINSESGKFAAVVAVCAALLTPVVRLRGDFSAIGAAIAVSALLILFLDLMRERISADALRVLVDIALLLPALVVLTLGH